MKYLTYHGKSPHLIICLFIYLFISVIPTQSQLSFRDVNGNILHTPTWPPPDSTYDQNTLTIWFNRSVINHDFLCWYWSNFYHYPYPIIKDDKEKNEYLLSIPLEYPLGCFPLTRDLFTNPIIYDALNAVGVKELCQYTMLSPCEDTVVQTHYGTTIPAPEFWNSFYVILDSNIALSALEWLIMQFGGRLIDFAELNTYMNPTSDLPNNPNDSGWVNGYQTAFLDTIFGENITGAWKYEHGNRNVKVAVVDAGIRFTHPDFGGGIGCDSCSIVNGREWMYDTSGIYRIWNIQDYTGDYPHGTACASLIGAKTNNEIGIAGIAGGWNSTDGCSLFSMRLTTGLKSPNSKPVWADAFFFASNIDTNYYTRESNTFESNHESKRKGFGVHIISNSNVDYLYNEQLRRVVDFAYKTGVSIFSAKGNKNNNVYGIPVDYEYNKVIAVGAYSVRPEPGSDSLSWIPTRWYYFDRYRTYGGIGSNFGYGLDIMGHTNNISDPLIDNDLNIVKNYSIHLDDSTIFPFDKTSAATPQVAGVGALILSKFIRHENNNFNDYESELHKPISWLAPEDVQGLLC